MLIIGFVWPEPNSSAAGTRMMQLIAIFQNIGYQITFVSTALNSEFSENLSDFNLNVAQIHLNDSSFDSFVAKLNPNIVLFDRFMTEEQFGWRVSEHCPHAMKILDTEDLHSLRLSRHEAVKNRKNFIPDDLLTSEHAKREIASMYRCDLSLFVSEFEINLVRNVFTIPESLVYYVPIFGERHDLVPSFDNRSDFVFVGNFLHEPNWDAVNYLKEKIWPLLHQLLPDAKMLVYGAYATQKVVQLHNPKQHFYIMGRTESAVEVVKNAKVVLAPLRFGAGIKGKLIEAMQCGTPSITTSIGSESMHGGLPWNGFIEDDIDKFVERAVQVYTDKTVWNQVQENGFTILEKRYSKDDFVLGFNEVVAEIENDLVAHRKRNFIGAMLQHSFHASTKYMSKWIEEKNKKIDFK